MARADPDAKSSREADKMSAMIETFALPMKRACICGLLVRGRTDRIRAEPVGPALLCTGKSRLDSLCFLIDRVRGQAACDFLRADMPCSGACLFTGPDRSRNDGRSSFGWDRWPTARLRSCTGLSLPPDPLLELLLERVEPGGVLAVQEDALHLDVLLDGLAVEDL